MANYGIFPSESLKSKNDEHDMYYKIGPLKFFNQRVIKDLFTF